MAGRMIYSVSSRYDDDIQQWSSAEDEWWHEVIDRVNRQVNPAMPFAKCAVCGLFKIHELSEPVDVAVSRCPRGVWAQAYAGLFRVDFFKAVRPYLRGAIVGRCINVGRSGAGRGLCGEYVSCYSSTWLPRPRGGPHSRYQICEACDGVRFEHISDPVYVLAHELDEHVAYVDSHGGLFLAQQLVDQIDWSRFPDARLHAYPIFDRPIDGQRLPGDPDWDAMASEESGVESHYFRLGTSWEERSLHGPAMVPHKPWLAQAKLGPLCRRCGNIDRTRPLEPIDVVVEPWATVHAEGHWDPVRRLQRTGVVILQREVLDAIRDRLREPCIGEVSLPDGTKLSGLVTLVLPQVTGTRPERNGETKTCDRCGAHWGTRGRAPGQLEPPRQPAPVLQDYRGDFYLGALVVPRLHDLFYHGLSIDALPVADC